MLKQTKKDETATENKLNLLNNDIKTRKKLIGNIQGEINALNGEMGTLRKKRAELEAEDLSGVFLRDIIKEGILPDDPRLQ